jgi:putative membrane protein
MVKQFFYKVFCGFFLGISVLAPGFSGSVVAIILGIYRDLLRIISNPFKRLKENVVFCIPLGVGAVVAAVVFILAFNRLFDAFEKATYLLFVGLIAGNLPVVFAEVRKHGFKKHHVAAALAAFAGALSFGIFAVTLGHAPSAEGYTAGGPRMAVGGLLGGVTALVPGMSVSIVYIIVGIYTQLLYLADALLHGDFAYLLPFGLYAVCTVAGLVLASRGIRHVYDKYPGFANSMILGFLSGSLIGILSPCLRLDDPGFDWFQGGVAIAAGLGVSMLFVALGKAMAKDIGEQRGGASMDAGGDAGAPGDGDAGNGGPGPQ